MKGSPKVGHIRTYSKNHVLVEERRKYIVRKVARILTKRGFHGVSMREIAEACDMPVGTVYRYIGSKGDILYLIVDNFQSEIATFCKQIPSRLNGANATQVLKWSISEFCRRVDEMKYFLAFSWREMRNLKPEQRLPLLDGEAAIVAAFEEILRRGCETGEFTVHNTSVVANNIVVLSQVWVLRHWFLKDKVSLDEFIEEQLEFVLHGVSGRD